MTETDRETQMQRALKALQDARRKIEKYERKETEPVAIVGMGCRYPGDVNNAHEYWDLLKRAKDALSDIPKDRWDTAFYYDEDADAPGKMYTRRGGFIKNIDGFDAEFFGIAPREAVSMDPQQRLFLEVCWEALEDAGIAADRLNGSNTALYAGVCTDDYSRLHMNGCDPGVIDAYSFTGTATSITVGRLSYLLGLQGPNVCVNTACSSSLVSVDMACTALRSGQSDIALAGGVNLIIRPENNIYFCKVKALSRSERCYTFDDRADGYVRSEGAGVVVLKRLSDALASRDHIYAVIKAVGVNQDGKSNGMTAPNGLAQQAVIRQALAKARLAPAQISYVEAHGTGTSLGDPIELQALGAVLAEGRDKHHKFYVGSAKTNLGHLEAAAGMAGLMKAALALEHEQIPAHLNFSEPNRHIPWDAIPAAIPTGLTAWQRGDQTRYAGVSSFGFSGTNCHVILQEPPLRPHNDAEYERPLHILNLSARTATALDDMVDRYLKFLAADDSPRLEDICFTAGTGRNHFTHRTSVFAADKNELIAKLTPHRQPGGAPEHAVVAANFQPRVAFVFTGQGSQYVNMGRELYATQPVFRKTMDRCAELLQNHMDVALLDVIFGEVDAGASINDTAYTQPALFALEYSLAMLWQSWGIYPSAVMGHSVGEYVAACIAGVFNLEDGLKLIAARGRLMQAMPANGGMVSVFTDADTVTSVVRGVTGQVVIAGLNARDETVISGEKEALGLLLEKLDTLGIKYKALNVSHAFHSPLMTPVLEAFGEIAKSIHFSAPQIEMISNVTGTFTDGTTIANPGYWCQHIIEPVRYISGVAALYQRGYEVFIEVGSTPILSGLAMRDASRDNALWLPTLRKGQGDWQQIMGSLAKLYVHGFKIDWEGFDRDYPRQRVSLPAYPFQRRRFWLESKADSHVNATNRLPDRYAADHHPLLGTRLALALSNQYVYAARINTTQLYYLADHSLFGRAVAPATAYVEMALAAGYDVFTDSNLVIEGIEYHEGLFLDKDEDKAVQLIFTLHGKDAASFRIASATLDGDGEKWAVHATGKIHVLENKTVTPAGEGLRAIQQRCTKEFDKGLFYSWLLERGYEFGHYHRGIEVLWRDDREALGRVRLVEGLDASPYQIHPALLDACCQVLLGMLPDIEAGSDDIYITIGKGQVTMYGPASSVVWSHACCRPASDEGYFVGDIRLYDEQGHVFAEITGYRTKRTSRSVLERSIEKDSATNIYSIAWREYTPTPPTGAPDPKNQAGKWLIFADEQGLAEGLAERLAGNGYDYVLVRPGQAFAVNGERQCRIDPASGDDYRRLMTECFDAQHPCRGVAFLWGCNPAAGTPAADEAPDTDRILEQQQFGYGAVVKLLQAQDGVIPNWLLVTQETQLVNQQPLQSNIAYSPLWGLGRVMVKEHPELNCVLLDLSRDETDAHPIDVLWDIVTHRDGMKQIALRNGKRYTPRLMPCQNTANEQGALHRERLFRLGYQPGGGIDSLKMSPLLISQPAPTQVQIKVAAAGLSFNDAIRVIGLNQDDMTAAVPLGHECSGTVTAIGDDVAGIEIGDEVIAYGTGCLASHVLVQRAAVTVKPKCFTHKQAATIPTAFLTAYYLLKHVAKVKKGERVLIHSAASGVGMAAVQLAQLFGAEVLATASPAKWHILKELGVKHIMNSRTLEFAGEVDKHTAGKGVDIVVNALSGEAVIHSLKCLTGKGRFIELGKGQGIDTAVLEKQFPQVAYHKFDLDEFLSADAQEFQQVFNWIADKLAHGDCRPLPYDEYPCAQMATAFRRLAQGRHIGRIVLDLDADGQAGKDITAMIRPDASYLITGGLGGLGLRIADWLVEKGVRCLILVSRHARTVAETARFEAKGVKLHIVECDVSDPEQFKRMMSGLEKELPSVKGVIHAAGMTDDAMLMQQSWQQYQRVMAPKILGAWNIHRYSLKNPLDFFILLSSVTSLLGADGVANYAAANAFLDGLANYRHSRGLHATSINWGPWQGAGMLADLGERGQQHWLRQGITPMSPDECLHALDTIIMRGGAEYAVLQADWRQYLRQYSSARNIPDVLLEISAGQTLSKEDGPPVAALLEQLHAVPEQEYHEVVSLFINGLAVQTLGLDEGSDIGEETLLSDVGLDSLMSVELRNKISAAIGDALPSSVMFDYPTIGQLAEYICDNMLDTQKIQDTVIEVGPEASGDDMAGHDSDSEIGITDELRSRLEQTIAQVEGTS